MRNWVCYIFALGLVILSACSPTQRNENSLTTGIGLEPPSLDPTYGAAAATDEIVYANVFEGLTRIGADGRVHPALAKSWTVDESGLVYEFVLQQNVKFHDGTGFDAQDVKFSLDRARADDSKNAQKFLFAMIENVEVLAPDRVRINLKRRTADFAYNMAWGDAVIVAPESAETNATHPVGTGPFMFERWQKGTRIVLKKNPEYWGAPANLEQINFAVIPDAASAYGALMAGDVDGFSNFPAPELLRQIKKDDRFRITVGVTEGETILGINNAKAPFTDIRIRKAIGHAIDRQALIKGAMFGNGTPIGSFFSPADPAYIDLTAQSAYDPEMARCLLVEAGYPDGFKTELNLPPPYYARRGGEIIAAQLRAVGIDAKIRYMEWAQWLEQVLGNKNYQLTIVSHTEPRDINFFAKPGNYFQYHNSVFDRLMLDIEQAQSDKERAALYKKAQKILADDAPVAFLFQLPKVAVWRKDIHGMWVNAPIQATDMTQVWREDIP